MPYTIDQEAMKKQQEVHVMRPQEPVPSPLPQNWTGTAGRGIPVKQIPILEFPRCIYMHPNEPTRTILHRNDKHEVVHEEIVPTEHLSKTVENKEELEAALAEGWVKEPYIPKAPKDPITDMYGPRKKKN